MRVLRIGGDDPKPTPLSALQVVLAHQAADALGVDRRTERGAHFARHAAPSIATAVLALPAPDLVGQLRIGGKRPANPP
jgi:hypothetical protein